MALASGCAHAPQPSIQRITDQAAPTLEMAPMRVANGGFRAATANRAAAILREPAGPEMTFTVSRPMLHPIPVARFMREERRLGDRLMGGDGAALETQGFDLPMDSALVFAGDDSVIGLTGVLEEGATEDELRAMGFVKMAIHCRRNQQWSAAVDLLTRALEGGADGVTVHYLLATTYMGLGQRLRAVHHCREILKIDPEHEWANRFLYGKEYKTFPKKRRYAFGGPTAWEFEFLLTR
jgi:hypothetical protein